MYECDLPLNSLGLATLTALTELSRLKRKYAESHKRLCHDNESFREMFCANEITITGGVITKAMYCKVLLCPVCSNRRRGKIFRSTMSVVSNKALADSRYIFITLTVRNVASGELSSALDHLLYSFKKFSLKRKVTSAVTGWSRTVEVTYNHESDTYHPHIHLLASVSKDYYTNGYISQSAISELWESCVGGEYRPVVDIRAVRKTKDHNGKTTVWKSVAELSKYTVKPTDVLVRNGSERRRKINISTEIVDDSVHDTLFRSLRHRRLHSFGGLFKTIAKSLPDENAEGDDFDGAADVVLDDDSSSLALKYNFKTNLYEVRPK